MSVWVIPTPAIEDAMREQMMLQGDDAAGELLDAAMGVGGRQALAELTARLDGLDSIGQELKRLAEQTVAKRRPIEERWLRALRQFSGEYEAETQRTIAASGGSKAFVNLTRPKVNTMEARLADILLPTNDTNFGISPTPKPDIRLYAEDLAAIGADPATVPAAVLQHLINRIARQRSEAMHAVIQDQLAECNYVGEIRAVLHDAALFGTGILKGPIAERKAHTQWVPLSDGLRTVHVAERETDTRPVARRVSPWDFFPDMSALSVDDADFVFERDALTKRQLRQLVREGGGYIESQVRRLLDQHLEAPVLTDTTLVERRRLMGLSDTQTRRFERFQYHGPLSREQWQRAGFDVPDDYPLDDVDVVVELVDGIVIKALLNPLDTQERVYQTFVLEESDVSLFGYGVPDMMASSQSVANATWRMLVDNGALSAGLQVAVNKAMIQPQGGGKFSIKPRGIWVTTEEAPPNYDVRNAVSFFDVPNKVQELMALFNMALRLIDEETMQPQIASGSQGNATRTAQGMTILMNAANTVLRRIVKSFDDGITRPFIRRLYDWNMQYSPDPSIKGDFQVVARGTTALLDKEGQIEALLQTMQMAAANPILQRRVDFEEMGREIFKLMRVDPERFMKSDEQMQQEAQGQASPTPQPDPVEMANIELKREVAQADMRLREQALQLKGEELAMQREARQVQAQLKLAELDASQRSQLEALTAKFAERRMAIDSQHRLFDAEQQIKAAYGSGL